MTPEEFTQCQTNLAAARAALLELVSGKQVVEVKNEFTSTRYTPATKADLAEYIAQLESQCGCTSGGKSRRPFGVVF